MLRPKGGLTLGKNVSGLWHAGSNLWQFRIEGDPQYSQYWGKINGTNGRTSSLSSSSFLSPSETIISRKSSQPPFLSRLAISVCSRAVGACIGKQWHSKGFLNQVIFVYINSRGRRKHCCNSGVFYCVFIATNAGLTSNQRNNCSVLPLHPSLVSIAATLKFIETGNTPELHLYETQRRGRNREKCRSYRTIVGHPCCFLCALFSTRISFLGSYAEDEYSQLKFNYVCSTLQDELCESPS